MAQKHYDYAHPQNISSGTTLTKSGLVVASTSAASNGYVGIQVNTIGIIGIPVTGGSYGAIVSVPVHKGDTVTYTAYNVSVNSFVLYPEI